MKRCVPLLGSSAVKVASATSRETGAACWALVVATLSFLPGCHPDDPQATIDAAAALEDAAVEQPDAAVGQEDVRPRDADPDGNEGVTDGQAVGKFCHQLTRNGSTIELTLEIGSPAIIRLTAETDACSTAPGVPCAAVPVGVIPARLLEGAAVLASGHVRLEKDQQYVFTGVIGAMSTATVTVTPVMAPPTCSAISP
jgi:hypothetical protein